MCFCIVLHYTGGNDLLSASIYIKRWTHGFSKNTSLKSNARRLVRIYICYIYSTKRFDGLGKAKVLKLLLENGPLCHAIALERTLSRVLML